MAALGYLANLERGLGLVFDAHFLHGFFCKNVPYLICTNGQSFSVTPYFFLNISNKMCH